jgi:hypothetical protein
VSAISQPAPSSTESPARDHGSPTLEVPGRKVYGTLWNVFATGLLAIVAIQVVAGVLTSTLSGWWPAWDTNAYWLAARHVLDGQPLYQPATITAGGAYKYPPLFAQMVVPIAFVPEVFVDWAWRIGGVLCVRYLCGSWRLALLVSLQWPIWLELQFGNVTLQLAAACFFALRHRRGAYLLPWFAALKGGPGLLIVYLWWTRPDYRRALAIGCAVFAAACTVSVTMAPGLWADYLGTFGWEAASDMQAWFVVALVPSHGGLDFAIRLAIAGAAILAAIRWRADWLAFVVAVATMPILSTTRLGVLVGLWPLWLRDKAERWRQRGSRAALAAAEGLVRFGMLPPARDRLLAEAPSEQQLGQD